MNYHIWVQQFQYRPAFLQQIQTVKSMDVRVFQSILGEKTGRHVIESQILQA